MSPTYHAFLQVCMWFDRHMWAILPVSILFMWAFVGGIQRFFDTKK